MLQAQMAHCTKEGAATIMEWLGSVTASQSGYEQVLRLLMLLP
jgi:hypothetical protein